MEIFDRTILQLIVPLYNIEMKGMPLLLRMFFWAYPVFCCDKIPIFNFDIFTRFH